MLLQRKNGFIYIIFKIKLPKLTQNLKVAWQVATAYLLRIVFSCCCFNLQNFAEIKTTAQNVAPRTDLAPPPEDQTTDNGPLPEDPQTVLALPPADLSTVLALQSDGPQTDHGLRHGDLPRATVGMIVVK